MKPLFIVGPPRSGTTLMRDICNNHSQIVLPDSETHFIPQLYKKFYGVNDLDNYNVYKYLRNTTFIRKKIESGYSLAYKDIEKSNSLQEIIRVILIKFSDNKKDIEYFGDKTPAYIEHLGVLLDLFPKAKFLVMVRDPRDVCWSAFNYWQKSVYRTAHDWKNKINSALDYIDTYPEQFLVVRFEDFVDNPTTVLTEVCNYLEIHFSEELINLKKPSAVEGDAKNTTKILKNNYGKYLDRFDEKKIKKIEEITYPYLKKYYNINYANRYNDIGDIELSYYRILDVLKYLEHNSKEYGMLKGIQYSFKRHKEHS